MQSVAIETIGSLLLPIYPKVMIFSVHLCTVQVWRIEIIRKVIEFNTNLRYSYWNIKMINVTEDVCLFEKWNHDISMNVENSEQHLLLQDPYDSVWLKIIAFFSYLIGLIASAIMLAFINYEKGHHGNFRTVINQLLSNLYAMVSKRFAI